MAKEVFDNEKLKKVEKSGEGIYSEEAGNVLNENTPEGKYIANIELKINEVKEKIKSNKKSLAGVKRKIPSYEKERKMIGEMIEEFSIEKLSEFLSNEELEIVKNGRKFSELDKILKKKTIDPLNDLIEKIYESIKNFSDEEKFILADYLLQKKILMLSMDSTITNDWNIDYYTTLRGVGDYFTDNGKIMYMAHEIQKNINKLGLQKHIIFRGDSCYGISEVYYDHLKKYLKDALNYEDKNKLKFDALKEEGEKLEKELKDLIEKQNAVKKFGLPESEAIPLYQRSKDFEGKHDEIYDKVNHVYVVLHEYSDYIRGAGGSEYGTVINIKRGKNTTKKSFMYRDRYDSEKDNPRHRYQKIKNVKVDGDRVEVTVSNGKSNDTYAFNVEYKPLKEGKVIDKEKFEEGIKTIKEQLIEENTKDGKYPASHNLSLRKVLGYFSGGRDIEAEIPYEKAKIVYEDVIPEKGEAHITILMQKDDSGTKGRQFGLIKYIVSPEGAKKIDELDYREENLTDKELQNKMNEFTNW